MPIQTWTIIADTFREARDKKLFWVLLLLSTIVAAALACVGFDEKGWSFFFGALTIENPMVRAGTPESMAVMGSIVSDLLVKNYIGRIGVVLCLIGTAGMFPALLRGGAIEVTLSKPMSRLSLFAAKYVGCLAFVLVQATYFVLLTFVILRMQLGFWYWSYLWAIPLLAAAYSYLHCVSVLAAVIWRNTLVSLICALLFWLAIVSVSATETIYLKFKDEAAFREARFSVGTEKPDRGAFATALRTARTVLPKTDEIPFILARSMNAANTEQFMRAIGAELQLSPDERHALNKAELRVNEISTVRSIGSSLLFEVVVLALGWWIFRRRDF